MKQFNLAMLGKQGWRLISRPESLCAQVLKGRYFHDSDFMKCTRKKHASQTWRAILAGREVLDQGLIKRIGDGSLTNIWRDRWVLQHFNGRPITPMADQNVTQVADLLTESGHWNEDLICQVFFPVDADAILRTLARGFGEDIWAWELEKHGMYSVRSAYKLLDNRRMAQMATLPSTSSDDVWRKIWKLEVPPKVHVFWWRVVHGFLPARSVLHRRHVEPIAYCETCGADEESIRHVLIECTVAKAFWEQARVLIGIKLPNLHPQSWAADLLSDICSQRERAIIICGLWSLWTMRNKRRHGEAPLPIHKVVEWIKDTAFDLWCIIHPSKLVRKPLQQKQWAAPMEHCFKCNVDASFYELSRQGGTAVVIHDHNGAFCGAQAKWHEFGVDALMMEALACKEGLEFARQHGVQRVHLETDCLELVRLWKMEGLQRSIIMPVLQDMKEISLAFQDFSISHVGRDCNRVAHELAKQVSSTTRLGMWHTEPPACVQNLLIKDCNHDV
jgi:ribonuclease HI